MKVRDALLSSGLLRPGMHILCALSGGGDSVCLTHALCTQVPELSLTLSAAHFSHGIRPEDAQQELAICKALCQSLDIPLHWEAGDTPAYAQANHLSMEQAARTLRYAFLKKIAAEIGADAIAVAHHQGDNAETILLNLIRGSGSAGLEGIPPRRGNIIRPLLQCPISAIHEYLQNHHLAYATDPTNLGSGNARSLLRNEIFPKLHLLNPQASLHMVQASETLRRQNEAASGAALCFAASAEQTEEGLSFSLQALLALPEQSACMALQQLQRKAGGQMLTRPQLEMIFSVCHSEKPSGQVYLSGTRLVRRYDQLLLCSQSPPAVIEPILLAHYGRVCFGKWEIVLQPDDGSKRGFCLPEAAVFPLLIRSRCPGDTLVLPGGSKTLKKWMIDRKIPKDLRDITPILCHNNNILAVADFPCVFPREAKKEKPQVQIICRRLRS